MVQEGRGGPRQATRATGTRSHSTSTSRGRSAAIQTLRRVIDGQPITPDTYALLGGIYEKQGKHEAARGVYQQAVENARLAEGDRVVFGKTLKDCR